MFLRAGARRGRGFMGVQLLVVAAGGDLLVWRSDGAHQRWLPEGCTGFALRMHAQTLQLQRHGLALMPVRSPEDLLMHEAYARNVVEQG